MDKSTLLGVIIMIVLFLGLSAFFASKLEVNLPYTTEHITVLDMLWDNFSDWINPFN